MFLLEGFYYYRIKLDLKSVILLLDFLVRFRCLFIIGVFKGLNIFNRIIRIWEFLIIMIIILRIRNEEFY